MTNLATASETKLSEATTNEVITNETEPNSVTSSKTITAEETLREAGARTTAADRASNNSNANAKIGFEIGEIDNEQLVGKGESEREYWVDETITAAVDLDISGDGVKYDNPVVRIKVKKQDIITKPEFAASQGAISSKDVADKDYYIFEHTFKTLTGGQHITCPLPYKFTPTANVKSGDRSEVEAEFFTRNADGQETIIKTAKKTYIAKFAEIKTHLHMERHNMSKFMYEDEHGNETETPTESPIHYRDITVNADDIDKTRMSPGTSANYWVLPYLYIDLPEGVTGKKGYTYPKNITFKITFNDAIIKSAYDYRITIEDKKTMTITITNPGWTDSYNNKPAWYNTFNFEIENAKLNEKIKYNVDYYINYGEKDQKQIQPSRHGYIYLTPKPFAVTGSFSIWNDGRADIGDPQDYYLDVPYSTWSRDSAHYSYMHGDLFYRSNNIKDVGMIQRYVFTNDNKGGKAGQAVKTGGWISKLKELTVELKSEGEYFKALNLAAIDEKLKEQIDQTNNTLYGIKLDGTEVEIAKNVKRTTRTIIDDPTRTYSKIKLVFDAPIKLDNQKLTLVTYTHLTQTELDKFKNKEYKDTKRYKTHATAKVQSGKEPFASENYEIADSNDELGYHVVSPIQPIINEYLDDNKTLTYEKGGKVFSHIVGPYVNHNNDSSTWGDIKKVEKVKTVTLLPTGIVYVSAIKDNKAITDGIELVENYKNTGKTAVIVSYKDLVIKNNNYENDRITLKLKATKHTNRGDNIIETYLIYDQNDIVKPYSKDLIAKDTFDLDDDDDKEEFMLVKRTITYVPAYELILHKDIRDLDGHEVTATSNLDLNDKLDYVISLMNNSLVDVKTVEFIDKLPFIGDKTIVPNEQGKYAERNSKFVVKLRDFVENIKENEEVLKKFDVYYQIVPQNNDNNTLETIRDGEWLTRTKLANQSIGLDQVKNLKFVLKQGQTLKSKEEARFVIPAIMPSDTSLARQKDPQFSVGTAAFSQDGQQYNEANNAQSSFTTYAVEGKVYEDKNGNGLFDQGDSPIVGAKVEIVQKDALGNESVAYSFKDAKLKDREKLETTTDQAGNYHFAIYSRGEYTVKVTKGANYTFATQVQTDEEKIKNNAGNTVTVATTSANQQQTNEGRSAQFRLDPGMAKSIQNAALQRSGYSLNYIVQSDEKYGSPKDSAVPRTKEAIPAGTEEILEAVLNTTEKIATFNGNNVTGQWKFTGWSKDKDNISDNNLVQKLTIKQDTTVYGKWEFIPEEPRPITPEYVPSETEKTESKHVHETTSRQKAIVVKTGEVRNGGISAVAVIAVLFMCVLMYKRRFNLE